MFTRSIRWRLQLWLAFLLGVVLCGFGLTAYQLHRINRFRGIDEELERRLAILGRDLRPRPPGNRPHGRSLPDARPDARIEVPPVPFHGSGPGGGPLPRGPLDGRWEEREIVLSALALSLFEADDPNGFYFAVWSRGGTTLARSSNAPPDLPRPEWATEVTPLQVRTLAGHRQVYQRNGLGDSLLVGRSITGELEALRRFGWWLAAAGAGVLALGLGGGWMLAGRAIRPLDEIGAAARRIAAGNLSERINLAGTDNELGHLARVLNATFARLEAAFAQQRQFTADASHELRTPISVLITEAQTALARERSAAEYRETVEACLETAQGMRRLTESLLELARFDAGQERLDRQPCDLAEQARVSVGLVRRLAEAAGITIESELVPVLVSADGDRLAQVITNLLANAVHHHRPGGRVWIRTRADTGSAVVEVSDDGPGIGSEDLPHVFERFYQGDRARAGSNGRAGLGLAIARAVVQAHGGTLEVRSQPGAGATFTVRLPG